MMEDRSLNNVSIEGDIATGGLYWHSNCGLRYDLQSANFTTRASFKEWFFDAEVGIIRRNGLWSVYHPHVAVRILGLDIGLGIMIRPAQKVSIKGQSA